MASAAIASCKAELDCQGARRKLAQLRQWRTDAAVADAVYKRPPPLRIANPDGSFKTLVSSPEELRAAGLEPGDLTIANTNFGAVIYKEGEPPRYTASFRGTESWSDVVADYEQAFDQRDAAGAPNKYYSRAQEIAKNMAIKAQSTGNPAPHFVGHSLGGGLASAAAKATGATATTFNAAGLHAGTVAGPYPPGAAIAAVYVRGEALTALQRATPLPDAIGVPHPLDPPFHLGRDVLAQMAGYGLAGPLGLGGAETLRAGLLHRMPNVIGSLDKAIATGLKNVTRLCGGGR